MFVWMFMCMCDWYLCVLYERWTHGIFFLFFENKWEMINIWMMKQLWLWRHLYVWSVHWTRAAKSMNVVIEWKRVYIFPCYYHDFLSDSYLLCKTYSIVRKLEHLSLILALHLHYFAADTVLFSMCFRCYEKKF